MLTFLEAISEATPIGMNTTLTSKNAEITCRETTLTHIVEYIIMSNEFKKVSSSVTARGVRIGLQAGSSC